MSGLFVSFEGPEGAGKTTQIDLLRRRLAERDPVITREPGGTELGERIRELVLHGPGMAAEAEMYLFMAARAELIEEVIRPALAAGRMVIADRYHDSTLVYQGLARGIVAGWPASFPNPDRTILLSLPAEVGLARLRGARPADRLESEGLDFHRAVVAGYEQRAAVAGARITRIDATQPPAAVHEQVMASLEPLLAVAR